MDIETAQISLKRTVSYHHQKRLLGYFRILIFHSFVRNGFVLLTFFGNSPAFNEKHFTNAEEFPITVPPSLIRFLSIPMKYEFGKFSVCNIENIIISKKIIFDKLCFLFSFFSDQTRMEFNGTRIVKYLILHLHANTQPTPTMCLNQKWHYIFSYTNRVTHSRWIFKCA